VVNSEKFPIVPTPATFSYHPPSISSPHLILITMAMAAAPPPRIYIYTGGRAPAFVPFAIVDPCTTAISAFAFERNYYLLDARLHNFVSRVEEHAFALCRSLTQMWMMGVKIVDYSAFYACIGLFRVEFGTDLETIGESAFDQCTSLRHIKMPSVIRIGSRAFQDCAFTELDLPKELEVVEECAFAGCPSLVRVSMPLKEGMIQRGVFLSCDRLSRIDLVGDIHDVVSSLHLEAWRNDMTNEIDRINRVLPLIPDTQDKTTVIQEWMQSVLNRIEHYKGEHYEILKEIMTIVELALWSAKLLEAEKDRDEKLITAISASTKNSSSSLEEDLSEKLKIDNEWNFRQEQRVACCAGIVIRNVIPFLGRMKFDS
jgi:hypothetical protein